MIFAIVAVVAIVYIQEGQRRIPIQYASRVRGRRMYQGGATFLPLRVNQAGVIPIIFAISILLLPSPAGDLLLQLRQRRRQGRLAGPSSSWLDPHSWLYAGLYFLLTVGFTYFYTAFTFKPDETADQLRKNGGFIPGIRPGSPTRDYLARVVVPHQPRRGPLPGRRRRAADAHLQPGFAARSSATFGLGGTALLIVVSVVVETMKQLEAQLMMRNYEGFIR